MSTHVRSSISSTIPSLSTTLPSGETQWHYTDIEKPDCLNRVSYMSAHVLLNLLNELGKRDKMRGLPSILSLFRNEFNKFNNTSHEC